MDVAMADAIREPASLTSSPYVSPPSRNGFKPDSQAKAPGGSNSDAVRHALRPILVTMLERRREFGTDTSTGPINVDAILANMTDEYCTAFIAQAKLVMTQMKELNIKRGELATSSVVANGTGEPHQVPGEPPTSITSNTPEAAESRPGGHSGRDSVSMRQAEDFLQSMKDVVSPAVLSEELSRGAHPPAPERSENYTPPANTLPDGSHQKNEAAEQHPNTLAIPEPKTAALSGNVEQHPNDGHEGTQIAVASDEMTSDVAMYLPPIPGLWLVKFGLETPGILDAPFDVPDEVADAAHRWAKRRTSFEYVPIIIFDWFSLRI
ncbi:hypothetical protein BD410DRAFT_21434 [Rickenella mellea]|uniref:Uncharacterized protein n=1 Tax=Rickenella mellea TaxID=50990 RepID=A0A4R5XEB2_9AGAM|nr:hypothetical protein BD410DRAFT_21434 [Rickenella mellea]